MLPDLAYVDRLPDEVGAGGDRRHEVGGNRSRSLAGLVVRKSHVLEVEPPLGRGVDRDLVDRMQGALRERREGADALDLVAEELDAERLAPGRRIDVDDASAEGELPSLLRLVDALVAREGEVFDEGVDAPVVAGANANRLGAGPGRGHALGERGSRCADEAAGGEDVEGACPLPDEVRRRLEARAPAHAPAGEERDAVVAEEPGRGLGDVARVRVLGREHDERAAELFVERRDDERQSGLGDTRAGFGQLLEEQAEALALGELTNERVEHG